MKKPYNTVESQRSWIRLLVAWVLLLLPGLSFGQTFIETMGNIASQESATAANNRGAFDNDNLSFSGTAYGGTTPTGNSPTAVPVIFFGGTGGNTGTAAATFQIAGINTSTVANPALRFALYGDPAGNSANTFTVEYSANGGAFVNLPYTDPTTTSNTWTVKTASLPSSSSLTLRFTKTASTVANRFRLDNVEVFSSSPNPSPTITVNPAFNNFGNQTVNTASAGAAFTVTGSNLGTTPITVTAPAGFQVSATQNGVYTSSLSLAPTNGSVNTTVYVRFLPTSATAFNGNVTFVSGSGNASTFVAGQGVAPAPTLTASPTTLTDFGSVQVGQVSSSQTFTVAGANLVSNVTVTPPTNFQIRLPNGTFGTGAITIVPSGGSVNQAVEVRFQPTTAGTFNNQVTVASTNAPTATVDVSGTGTPQPTGPFIAVNPNSLNFGTVSATGSAQTLSFTVNAGNLTAPLVLTGSTNNIVFRDATAGGSFTNGPLTIAPSSGTVPARTIEVQLTGPIAGGPFNGSITASSTGATSQVVTITANSTGNNSVINASGNLARFETVPGVPSATQSYTLSGSNLLQDITVAAPQFFQVSTDPNFTGVTGTGNSIIVARNSGSDVTPTTIYVRFLTPDARTVSSLVLNSSAPAVAQGIPVAGTSEPSIVIANGFQQVRNVVLNTTSASQTLTINAQRVLQPVTISSVLSSNPLNPGNTPQFELSLDNVNFSNTLTLTPSGTSYTINQPIYVRYRPTYLGTAQSTLQFQSNDFANKSAQAFGSNDLLGGSSIDVEPTLRSTATVVRNGTTATVSFNLPANYAQLGYGEGRLIVASTSPELPASGQPQDGTSYQTGNQTYGQGPQIAPGFFSVYAGANQTTVIDGLDLATTYYFYTFEYNNIDNNFNVSVIGAENYLSPPVPTTIPGIIAPSPLPVTLVSFSAKVKGSQVAITWETASELNNKQFEVQRSRDGRSFETLAIRAGKGTTSASSMYNEVDKAPLNGVSYYRLKQVDLDGSFSFSSLVSVSYLGSAEVTMFPNPVEDKLTINVGGPAQGMTAIISDMSGRTLSTQKLNADSALDMSSLQPGTYLVTVGEGTAKVTRRIVKK